MCLEGERGMLRMPSKLCTSATEHPLGISISRIEIIRRLTYLHTPADTGMTSYGVGRGTRLCTENLYTRSQRYNSRVTRRTTT
jgi:hypothetical protein